MVMVRCIGMIPFSHDEIVALQGMTAAMYVDDIEIRPLVESDDGYGNDIEAYPSVGRVVKGSLQEVQRIPGTPETGADQVVIGNFIIKLVAGSFPPPRPKKCRFVVNGGDTYESLNPYWDRGDRLADTFYCYRIE